VNTLQPREEEVDTHINQIATAAIDEQERMRTYREAAGILNVPYHVVQRAARRGLVPTYRLGTSRPYVKLRDFLDLASSK
jgi:hypothetical protein